MKRSTAILACTLGGALVLGAVNTASADNALANKNLCIACHAVDKKVLGPAYRDIAAKYKGQLTSEQLAKSIKAGGSGKWGSAAMPPQPGLSNADAVALASWILDGAK